MCKKIARPGEHESSLLPVWAGPGLIRTGNFLEKKLKKFTVGLILKE
jgi:hypothetical protein